MIKRRELAVWIFGLCVVLIVRSARGDQPAPVQGTATVDKPVASPPAIPQDPVPINSQQFLPGPIQDPMNLPAQPQTDVLKSEPSNPPILKIGPAPIRTVPEFFGDQAPIGSLLTWPRYQANGQTLYVPSARYFKISDNDSPQPQTRAYFSFNYFYDLNAPVNQAAGNGIQHTRIHRETFGLEWADNDGSSSLGLRLPINTFNAANTVPGLDGATTDIGDLTIISKDILWKNKETGNLISTGLAITPPTGPGSFAGSANIEVFHHCTLQPFCGSIWSMGDFYFQHFTAVDVPLDLNDVVMLSNDLAIGYLVFQRHHADGLTAVAPTIELHVNTPLNHRGVMALSDPAGNPDMIDITGGVHFEYKDRSSLGIAFATPVAGPRMFNFEILAQMRWRY